MRDARGLGLAARTKVKGQQRSNIFTATSKGSAPGMLASSMEKMYGLTEDSMFSLKSKLKRLVDVVVRPEGFCQGFTHDMLANSSGVALPLMLWQLAAADTTTGCDPVS